MIVSIAVIAISVVLFLYWFRYTCLLVLSAKTSHDYSGEVSEANHLQFAVVERQLAAPGLGTAGWSQLDPLERALARDYDVIQALLRHTSAVPPVEDRILRLDYRLMRLAYRLSRNVSPRCGAITVAEMCRIVGYFANSMGERSLACGE